MGNSTRAARIIGSTLAGGAGFLIGFYAGFFLLLSIWGLETGEVAFVLIAGGLGVLLAGAAIALTVRASRRWLALLTNLTLGVLMLPLLLLFDSDPVGMAIGGLVVVVGTSVLVRSGVVDSPFL